MRSASARARNAPRAPFLKTCSRNAVVLLQSSPATRKALCSPCLTLSGRFWPLFRRPRRSVSHAGRKSKHNLMGQARSRKSERSRGDSENTVRRIRGACWAHVDLFPWVRISSRNRPRILPREHLSRTSPLGDLGGTQADRGRMPTLGVAMADPKFDQLDLGTKILRFARLGPSSGRVAGGRKN